MTDTERLADVIALVVHAEMAPLLAKIAALEARPVVSPEWVTELKDGATDLRARLAAVENRALVPGPPGTDGAPGRDGVDGRAGEKGLDGAPGRDGVGLSGAILSREGHLVLTLSDGSAKDVGLVVGRDGLAGATGQNGADGLNGKDGAQGLGFDDLDLVFDDARGYVLRCQSGDRVKEWPLPSPFDAGVWQAGRTYPKGSGTTVKGAWWIAQKDTSERPGDSRDWRLAVKGGRDGKDGKDGKDGDS